MAVEPYDDPSIFDDDHLIRRIDPTQHVVPDHNHGGYRVSSKAFCESSEGSRGMSIDLKKDIEAAGFDASEYVRTPKYTGAVEVLAETPRAVNLIVGREPEDLNPFHGEIWRPGETRRFSVSQKKKLLAAARWLNKISDVRL